MNINNPSFKSTVLYIKNEGDPTLKSLYVKSLFELNLLKDHHPL